MTIREFLSRFEGVKVYSDYWMARCPAHDDRNPSLQISQGNDGRILVNDHGGCQTEAVLAAKNLTMADLFVEKSNGNGRVIEATYDYRDETGKLLFQAVRYIGKDFSQRNPDGAGGWIWKLEGVRRVPYRLPELMAADPNDLVFLPEGEK